MLVLHLEVRALPVWWVQKRNWERLLLLDTVLLRRLRAGVAMVHFLKCSAQAQQMESRTKELRLRRPCVASGCTLDRPAAGSRSSCI